MIDTHLPYANIHRSIEIKIQKLIYILHLQIDSKVKTSPLNTLLYAR